MEIQDCNRRMMLKKNIQQDAKMTVEYMRIFQRPPQTSTAFHQNKKEAKDIDNGTERAKKTAMLAYLQLSPLVTSIAMLFYTHLRKRRLTGHWQDAP